MESESLFLNEKSPTVLSFISLFFGDFFFLLLLIVILVVYQHTVREINGYNHDDNTEEIHELPAGSVSY
jgi:hypothetical protein